MRTIAQAFLNDQRIHLSVTTSPGRQVNFRGRHANVQDMRDMPTLLQMPNLVIEMEPEFVELLPVAVSLLIDPVLVKAKVQVPSGWEMDASTYNVKRTSVVKNADPVGSGVSGSKK